VDITKKHGILFICDEVQTGIGRTGKMFAIENWNVEPDILTMAKALANGIPVGAYATTPRIANAHTKPGASTLGGNPVTAETVLATLDVHEKYNLKEKAGELGTYFKERLQELQEKYPLGAELVNENKVPAAAETDWILEFLKDHGVFIGKTGIGRNVLTFQPPLIITRDNIDEVIAIIDRALEKLPDTA
jgi:4-aminobutyrate aminotransferase/4-aminobutyrate aminotransferase/(S)-3-amino-2-methylpropionate transaminase